MADALGMAHRIGDGHGAALRDAEQREPVEAGRLDHALEVAHEGVERDVVDVPVGQAVAARVVADQPVLGGERLQQMAPDRALPIVFQMIEPVGGLEQRRSVVRPRRRRCERRRMPCRSESPAAAAVGADGAARARRPRCALRRCSSTVPTKRTPLRAMVRIRRCSLAAVADRLARGVDAAGRASIPRRCGRPRPTRSDRPCSPRGRGFAPDRPADRRPAAPARSVRRRAAARAGRCQVHDFQREIARRRAPDAAPRSSDNQAYLKDKSSAARKVFERASAGILRPHRIANPRDRRTCRPEQLAQRPPIISIDLRLHWSSMTTTLHHDDGRHADDSIDYRLFAGATALRRAGVAGRRHAENHLRPLMHDRGGGDRRRRALAARPRRHRGLAVVMQTAAPQTW